MRVVAVIPAFNEEARVANVVRDAQRYVDTVIVIDDGSVDQTAARAGEAGALVLKHAENCGAGAATMTGIHAARRLGAGALITLDADEQHDPADIPELLRPIAEQRADIVFANRFGQRNRIPLIRRFFNTAGNFITFFATGMWVHDSQCGFKALGPRAINEMDVRMSGYEFCSEMVREAAQHRWRIAQLPVKVIYSEYTLAKGQSFAGGVRTAFKILIRSFLR